MKRMFFIWLLLVMNFCRAQVRPASFSSIDGKVQSLEAPTLDSLAHSLALLYPTELEKVRAIFSWIAQHIAYNTAILHPRMASKYVPEPIDTVTVWKSANEMTAEKVWRKRMGVCDGYAKLFKTLCDYCGIRSEIINGYARCYMERSDRFRTNHSWNAVQIDSAWHLLDVTWASGYVNFANEYVQHMDENYFLPSPRQFILDHYPEDLRWTLLENPPTASEFRRTPFRYKSFIKYGISAYTPSNGLIEAAVGDTIRIELQVKDAQKNKLISADPFFDSTLLSFSSSSVFLQPFSSGNKAVYSFTIADEKVEWLNILYNDDMVLRYRLNVRKSKQ